MSEVRRHIVVGDQGFGFRERPQYDIGDARFLDLSWPHPVQIRPIVFTDLIEMVICEPGGLWMVVKRYRPGSFLRAMGSLPEHLRQNTPRNADRAWRREQRKAPYLAAAERLLETDARNWRRTQRRQPTNTPSPASI